jgi:hypothetical protein
MSTGSQVTFSQNMETTHTYDPQDTMKEAKNTNTRDDISESSDSTEDEDSSKDSTTGDPNKVQTTGNSTSKEESGQGSSSGSGSSSDSSSGSINSDSNTAANQKLLTKNPAMLQKLINNNKPANKPGKTKPKKSSLANKITPNKPKKAGSPSRGAGKHN